MLTSLLLPGDWCETPYGWLQLEEKDPLGEGLWRLEFRGGQKILTADFDWSVSRSRPQYVDPEKVGKHTYRKNEWSTVR